MSNSSAFVASCVTTAAAVFFLLLARISMRDSPAMVEDLRGPAVEESVPVPAPPPGVDTLQPPGVPSELAQQQDLTQQLEKRIAEQDQLLQDLQSQIQAQRQEAQALETRLSAYESSVSMLTTQQEQFAGVQRESDRTQASLLWVGAGLVLVVLIGGALVLVILVVLVASQTRTNKSPSSQVVYTAEVPVPPSPYYQEQFLPQPRRTRRVYPQDIYDHEP
jgi:hypothetical protein